MSFRTSLALALWVLLPVAAPAQPAPAPAQVHDAAAPVAPPRYVSAFEGYRPLGNEPQTPEDQTPDRLWSEANDVVGKLGGHAAHIKDATPAGAAPPPRPADAARPNPHH